MLRLLALTALSLSLFSCVTKPAQRDSRQPSSSRTDCRAVMCPALAPPNCRPNEKIAPDGEGCCPKYKCVPKSAFDCARVRCMMRMPNCMRGEKAVDMRREGACCPDYKCVNQNDARNCMNSACPAVEPPKCEEGQQLRDIRNEGDCCPNWSCEDEGDSNEEL